eukprot:TRINITY_DN16409_c0_g1_i1.p2 TRINITY_DN16409_c0_g1~~TRINITY_DN16409_c0_g1_i1.p2  ORF type:complete len:470 (-),score=110.40 TRINITY_DN16409_c0_g1_i1:149-1510(-)
MAAGSSPSSQNPSLAALAGEVVEALRGKVQHSLSTELKRCERQKLYATLEDFRRADPSLRRIVVLGCTGAGKSSLMNVMGGWHLEQGPPDYEFAWRPKGGRPPLFNADIGAESVTQKVQLAHLEWLGDDRRPFTAVDTPGHDDSAAAELDSPEARAKLSELAADLHNKLRALGHIHLILVLHNDVTSGRLNPATYTILKLIDEKFAQAEQNVWENVVIAFSKCNAHDVSWRSQLARKKEEQQQALRSRIRGCNIDVPVLALGGGEVLAERKEPENNEEREGGAASSPSARARSRSPRRGDARQKRRGRSLQDVATSAADDFEVLWRCLQEASPLDTTRLQVFEGPDRKWERVLAARDEAEAQAKAAMIYLGVVLRLALLVAFFFGRSYLVPAWMSSFVLMNLPGPLDELVYFALFVYWVGPTDVMYSLRHFYAVWIKPKVTQLTASALPSHQD